MQRFVRRAARTMPVAHAEACFAAMAQPNLSQALDMLLSKRQFATVVVQPHFLFRGLLLKEIVNVVRSYAEQLPPNTLRIAGHLGPARGIAQAVIQLGNMAHSREKREDSPARRADLTEQRMMPAAYKSA
jgi:sirohydrochlorin ferrochelatase